MTVSLGREHCVSQLVIAPMEETNAFTEFIQRVWIQVSRQDKGVSMLAAMGGLIDSLPFREMTGGGDPIENFRITTQKSEEKSYQTVNDGIEKGLCH